MGLLCFPFSVLLVGNKVPVAQVKGAIVEQYKAAKLKEIQETLDPYTSLCHEKQVCLCVYVCVCAPACACL